MKKNIHIEGYYNQTEMTEVSKQKRSRIYQILLHKRNPFTVVRFGSAYYADKQSFDEWVRGGCKKMYKVRKREKAIMEKRVEESSLDHRRDCENFFGCPHKKREKNGYSRCPLCCGEYKSIRKDEQKPIVLEGCDTFKNRGRKQSLIEFLSTTDFRKHIAEQLQQYKPSQQQEIHFFGCTNFDLTRKRQATEQ